MKFTLALLIAAAVVGCALSCTDDSWSEFKGTYNKKYDSEEEEIRRREIYCENLKTIEEHNEAYERGETTYEMGVNQFTDWTHDEFVSWVQGRHHFKRRH